MRWVHGVGNMCTGHQQLHYFMTLFLLGYLKGGLIQVVIESDVSKTVNQVSGTHDGPLTTSKEECSLTLVKEIRK